MRHLARQRTDVDVFLINAIEQIHHHRREGRQVLQLPYDVIVVQFLQVGQGR